MELVSCDCSTVALYYTYVFISAEQMLLWFYIVVVQNTRFPVDGVRTLGVGVKIRVFWEQDDASIREKYTSKFRRSARFLWISSIHFQKFWEKVFDIGYWTSGTLIHSESNAWRGSKFPYSFLIRFEEWNFHFLLSFPPPPPLPLPSCTEYCWRILNSLENVKSGHIHLWFFYYSFRFPTFAYISPFSAGFFTFFVRFSFVFSAAFIDSLMTWLL